jgi:predicted nucleotidyltransferase
MKRCTDDPVLDRARDLLRQGDLTDILAIYAFGSVVSGHLRADSDVDLAVLCATPVDTTRLFEQARSLSVSLDRDVDLIDMRRAGSVLKKEILAHGVRIYCNDPLSVLDFEATSLSEYVRHCESIADLVAAVRSSGRAYAP